MTRSEQRIVRRKLELYQDYLRLADEKDKEALLLHESYCAVGGAQTIRMEPKIGTSGHKVSPESRMLEILTDQIEADRLAKEYREQADRIKTFIDAIDDERKIFLVDAYLRGIRYREIAKERGYAISGVGAVIERCLLAVPSELARASGLL